MDTKKKVDNFDILKAMCDRNKDIALSDYLLNFQRQQKRGGGIVTVGLASPHFDHLINQAATGLHTHKAVLLVYDIAQFEEIKNELES